MVVLARRRGLLARRRGMLARRGLLRSGAAAAGRGRARARSLLNRNRHADSALGPTPRSAKGRPSTPAADSRRSPLRSYRIEVDEARGDETARPQAAGCLAASHRYHRHRRRRPSSKRLPIPKPEGLGRPWDPRPLAHGRICGQARVRVPRQGEGGDPGWPGRQVHGGLAAQGPVFKLRETRLSRNKQLRRAIQLRVACVF